MIESIEFEHFRNLRPDPKGPGPIYFYPGLNLIYGQNAQGKTNLLEAIHCVLKGKSFKTTCEKSELLNWHQDGPNYRLRAIIKKNAQQLLFSSEIHLHTDQIQEQSLRPGKVDLLMIEPHDHLGFYQHRDRRLDFIDRRMAALSPPYGQLLGKYKKALRSRNMLLKKGFQRATELDRQQVDLLGGLLQEYGPTLIDYRKSYLQQLGPCLQREFEHLFETHQQLTLHYEPHRPGPLKNGNLKDQEWLRGSTLQGIHLDDLQLYLNGVAAKSHASLGQMKASFFSLLFAALKVHLELDEKSSESQETAARPIVLIDDLSSEFDGLRWKNLLTYMSGPELQFIVTSSNAFFMEQAQKEGAKLIEVTLGMTSNIRF